MKQTEYVYIEISTTYLMLICHYDAELRAHI